MSLLGQIPVPRCWRWVEANPGVLPLSESDIGSADQPKPNRVRCACQKTTSYPEPRSHPAAFFWIVGPAPTCRLRWHDAARAKRGAVIRIVADRLFEKIEGDDHALLFPGVNPSQRTQIQVVCGKHPGRPLYRSADLGAPQSRFGDAGDGRGDLVLDI